MVQRRAYHPPRMLSLASYSPSNKNKRLAAAYMLYSFELRGLLPPLKFFKTDAIRSIVSGAMRTLTRLRWKSYKHSRRHQRVRSWLRWWGCDRHELLDAKAVQMLIDAVGHSTRSLVAAHYCAINVGLRSEGIGTMAENLRRYEIVLCDHIAMPMRWRSFRPSTVGTLGKS